MTESKLALRTQAPASHQGGPFLARMGLVSTDGIADSDSADVAEKVVWRVTIRCPDNGVVVRDVELRPCEESDAIAGVGRLTADGLGWVPWKADNLWNPEFEIWPTWHVRGDDESRSPGLLETMHRHASVDGDRLRDSAKWMAGVIGLSLAALVGTSPLSTMTKDPRPLAIAAGVAGLALLGVTLMLVLRVIRPEPASYSDLQRKTTGPLSDWRQTLETQEDLYLPCGVKCLKTLRQTMIVEQLTLNALACAVNGAHTKQAREALTAAMEGRAARLTELRTAAANVVAIADFYNLRQRSRLATYGGGACAFLGIGLVIAAFALAAE